MATSIPSYQKACLAADDFNAALYLVGVSNSQRGLLEINHIPLANGLNNLTFTQFDSQPDTQKWASGAEKACYAYKGPTDAYAVVKVIQFGSATSYMSYFSSTGVVADPTFFGTLKFQSSKLFSWVGSFTVTGFNVFHMYAITPSIANSHWVGLRMGFVASKGGYFQARTNQYPPASEPLLSVGTYTSATKGASKGYSVIFYKAGNGQMFSTTSSDQAATNGPLTLLELEDAGAVSMNSIELSSDAFSVTMGETGYILDKAKDGISTVVYSITPKSSSSLNLVPSTGSSIPFSKTMVGTAFDQKIITYTVPDEKGPGVINSFDPVTGRWNGNGLLPNNGSTTPSPDPTSSKSSIGPIVGGVVGGILVIAIAVFLFVRRRRQNTPKPTDSTELAQLSTDANKFDGTDQGHGQYDQGNVQYVQGHVPYEQGYLQPDQGCVQHEQEYVAYEQGYPQPPSIIPPPPTVNRNITDSAYKVPAEPEVTPASPTATSSSYVSPTSYRDSTFSPGSPESVVEKADRFSVSNAPQYVPNSPAEASYARSPQSITH